jgi:hypothetical protein
MSVCVWLSRKQRRGVGIGLEESESQAKADVVRKRRGKETRRVRRKKETEREREATLYASVHSAVEPLLISPGGEATGTCGINPSQRLKDAAVHLPLSISLGFLQYRQRRLLAVLNGLSDDIGRSEDHERARRLEEEETRDKRDCECVCGEREREREKGG